MKTPRPSASSAFTLIELLVVIAIIALLAGIALPIMSDAMDKAKMTTVSTNAKTIAQIVTSASVDRDATGDPKIPSWPGDSAADSSGNTTPITSVSQYLNLLINTDYLKKPDAAKLLSAPGITPWTAGTTPIDGDKNCAFKIYKVTGQDGGNTLFMATKNYTYNTVFTDADAQKIPFGTKGFVTVQKGCSAYTLRKAQAQSLNTIGNLPGYPDLTTPGSENGDAILTQN